MLLFKIQALEHSHLPLIQSKNTQSLTLFFKHKHLFLFSQPRSGGPGHSLCLEAPWTWSHLQTLTQPGQLHLHINTTFFFLILFWGCVAFLLGCLFSPAALRITFLPADKRQRSIHPAPWKPHLKGFRVRGLSHKGRSPALKQEEGGVEIHKSQRFPLCRGERILHFLP